ncbi:hypothetical protein [Ponticoccus litoralis]|uniref:Uncharacterized protein n=1 Tax=Ponticoccus litoralis TaxID=422297 RepID=A0AAW9SPP7_9RHOB
MTTITRRRARAFALCAVMAGGAAAQDLPLPEGAERGFATVQDPGAYALPTGPFADGALPVRRAEGRVSVEAWQIPGAERTPFQLAAPIRDTLRASGFEILLDCPARACGGFDFRFATLVLPPPEMFVSLSAYHFVSALAPDGRAVSVLASRDSAMSYVQIIRVGAEASATPGTAPCRRARRARWARPAISPASWNSRALPCCRTWSLPSGPRNWAPKRSPRWTRSPTGWP